MPETVRETEENKFHIHSKIVPQVHNKVLTKTEKLLNVWLENMYIIMSLLMETFTRKRHCSERKL